MKIILALSLVVLMSGCTALGTVQSAITPTATMVLDAAVSIAVTAELAKDPLTTHAKAVAFKAIASQVLLDTSNPATTVAQLEAALNARLIKFAPNPIVAGSVIALIGGLQGALNNVIAAKASGPVTAKTLVAINGIAKQVIQVCSFYGA